MTEKESHAMHAFGLSVLGVAAVLALSLACGCQPRSPATTTPSPQPPVTVQTTRPSPGDITRFIVLPGNVLPNLQATLYAKVAGYLDSIDVDKGDTVKRDEVVARIQAPELLADLALFKADFEVAQIEHERTVKAREKAPDMVVPQSVDAARAKYLAAKASLERAETLLGFCQITAPFSGIVTRRQVDPGAFIPAATSGSSAQNAAIITLMDFSIVRVQAFVPEPEVPLIRNDLPAQVLIEELPGRVFNGKINRYAHHLDEARTMLVEIDLSNPGHELLPGMFATVRIGVETHTNTLILPTEAIILEKANAFAFAMRDNKARKVPLKTGFRDGSRTEILGGVIESDQVILAGKKALVDGQPVNVVEGK